MNNEKEILDIAKEYGVENNYFFKTTFERYQTQLKILAELKKTIEKEGTLVEKEYVKNRKNVYTHPAIGDFNKTTDSANKTVTTLLKVISALNNKDNNNKEDPLRFLIKKREKA